MKTYLKSLFVICFVPLMFITPDALAQNSEQLRKNYGKYHVNDYDGRPSSSLNALMNTKIPSGNVDRSLKLPSVMDKEEANKYLSNVYLQKQISQNQTSAAQFFVKNGVAYLLNNDPEGVGIMLSGFEHYVKQNQNKLGDFSKKVVSDMDNYTKEFGKYSNMFNSLFAVYKEILGGKYKGYPNYWDKEAAVAKELANKWERISTDEFEKYIKTVGKPSKEQQKTKDQFLKITTFAGAGDYISRGAALLQTDKELYLATSLGILDAFKKYVSENKSSIEEIKEEVKRQSDSFMQNKEYASDSILMSYIKEFRIVAGI